MAETAPKQGILTVAFKEKNALYMSYMPFIKNGGLFIATQRNYEMGEELLLLLSLLDETERLPMAGKIIWKTPPNAEGYRAAGVGVQFSDQDGGVARAKIETHLAGMLGSDRTTHTL